MRRTKPVRKKSVLRTGKRGGGSADLTDISPTEVLGPLVWLLDVVGVPRREVLATGAIAAKS